MAGGYFLVCSLLEKCGNFWKNGSFSGSLGSRLRKEAYLRIWFAIKGLYPRPIWGPKGVLWAREYAGCHPVEVCVTMTTTILFDNHP